MTTSILKWYGYYTDKTIPGIVIETNKQYNSQVHDFLLIMIFEIKLQNNNPYILFQIKEKEKSIYYNIIVLFVVLLMY